MLSIFNQPWQHSIQSPYPLSLIGHHAAQPLNRFQNFKQMYETITGKRMWFKLGSLTQRGLGVVLVMLNVFIVWLMVASERRRNRTGERLPNLARGGTSNRVSHCIKGAFLAWRMKGDELGVLSLVVPSLTRCMYWESAMKLCKRKIYHWIFQD